jgi:CheY-specific phosphatase CheX
MNERAILPQEVRAAFESAAATALSELAQIQASPDPTPQFPVVAPASAWVTAEIRLQRGVPGTMCLVLSGETAANFAARYLPEGTPLSDDLVNDVIGELANVIAGQAKTILKGTLYHFKLALPTVSRASSIAFPARESPHAFLASLTFESGQVLLVVDLTPLSGA